MTLIRPTFILLLLLSLLLGLAYPLAMTGVGKMLFPQAAEGSLIKDKQSRVVGSELIGQNFSDPKYFWGRLSGTSPAYNASASSGTNFGVNNPALQDAVKGRVAAIRAADPTNTKPIPVDLVTASASGLDPAISPAAAEYQIPRIVRIRGMNEVQLRALVGRYTEHRQFGILGEPRVNVLKLNLALEGRL